MCSLALGLACDWQEELELGRELIFCVQSIREVDTTNAAVSVDLHTQSFNIVRTIGSACEIGQVKLDLVPAFIESHGHGANERLDSCRALVVRGTEPSSYAFVVEHLHLECEILLKLKYKKRVRI